MVESKIFDSLRNIFILRGNAYAHLAKSFYGSFIPDELKDEILFLNDYIELLEDSGDDLRDAVRSYYEAAAHILPQDVDKLEFEYNRLFVGPSHLIAPPYESVYRTADHLVMGEPMFEVRRAYQEADLKIRRGFKEPDDHIALELEYLAELQKRSLVALGENDRHEVHKMMCSGKVFIEDHLLSWVPEFCQRVKEGSSMDFFRALADVLSLFIRKDLGVVKELEAVLDNDGEVRCL